MENTSKKWQSIRLQDGIAWFYFVQGEGEPLLFLHGGFDSCENYTQLFSHLEKDFQIIAVDRRGHGRTADSDKPFDYALMAQEVGAFTEKIGLGSFHLMGYSDGANIGFHLASLFPQKIKSLIAISGNYLGQSGMTEGWLGMCSSLNLALVKEQMPQVLEQYTILNPNPQPASYIEKTRALWSMPTVIEAEKLAGLKVPTLLVAGDRDIVLPAQAIEMQALIPDASLLMLPFSGHFVFQDFAFSSTAESTISVFKNFLLNRFSDHLSEFI